MRKLIMLIVTAMAMALGGSAHSDGLNHHGVDMQDLVIIHDQMSELDKQLSLDPNNPTLNHAMEQLENKLVVKLRKYNKIIAEINSKKDQALEAVPAAGKPD